MYRRRLNSSKTWVLIAPVLGVLVSYAAHAQTANPSRLSVFENITVAPNFNPDPTILRGISGGSLPASEISNRTDTVTGSCNGFVDAHPDHHITLTTFFSFLSLQVTSANDTTLVVRGPGGSWCNDDAMGKNPGITGEWLAGTYQVWVGSYERNTYHPYVIQLTGTR